MPKANSQRRKARVNLGLRLMSWLTAGLVEAVTVALLWMYEPDHAVALLYSAVTASMTLTGLIVGENASKLKTDPRAWVRNMCFGARVVSVLLILPTVFVGGGAMALRMEDRAALEYRGSEAFKADLLDSSDMAMDSVARRSASVSLERAIRPSQVRMDDPAFIGAVVSYLVLTLLPLAAVSFGGAFAPETPAQARARIAADRAAKSQATRLANVKAAQEEARRAARPGWFRGMSGKDYPAFESPDSKRA